MTYKEFAKYIKEKIESLFILQKDIAKQIPMKTPKYNKIENGKQEPTFLELQAICKILDIDLTEILELKSKELNHHSYYD